MRDNILKFELHKIKREIQIHGKEYTFYRSEKDGYNEDTGENKEIATVKGIFHISKGYVTNSVGESSITVSKGQPKLFVEYEKQIDIKKDDFMLINGTRYNVVESNNVQEYNIVSDISLEVCIDGN